MKQRSKPVDALRGVAAMSVLIWHSAGLFANGLPARGTSGISRFCYGLFFVNGMGGVQLFFVLSGWLVGGPFIRALLSGSPLPSTRTHLIRRSLRLLPAYWLALGANWVLQPATRPPGWDLLLHLTLIQWPIPSQANFGLQLAWTLTVELAFSLLLPLAAYLLHRSAGGRPVSPRRLLGWLAGLFVIGDVIQAVVDATLTGRGPWAFELNHSWITTLGQFAPGLAVAVLRAPETRLAEPRLVSATRRLSSPIPAACGLSTLTMLAVSVTVMPEFAVYGEFRALRALACGLILLVVTRPRPEHAPSPLTRLLAWLGTVSYGIYIWQEVAIRDLTQHVHYNGEPWSRGGWVTNAIVTVALTLPFAVASWHVVERPFIALSNRLTPRRASATAIPQRRVAPVAIAAPPAPVGG